MMHGQANVR